MVESVIEKYLLDSGFLCVDEEEHKSHCSEAIAKQEEKLKNILDETNFKEVLHLKYNLISHMFHIRNIECFKMLYLGIKLGMETEAFFNEENKEL